MLDDLLQGFYLDRLENVRSAIFARHGSYLCFSEHYLAICYWAWDRLIFEINDCLQDFEEWRKSSTNPLVIDGIAWDLDVREDLRRDAISDLEIPNLRENALAALLRVRKADQENPIGLAANCSVGDFRALINSSGLIVEHDLVEEPWLTRISKYFPYCMNENYEGYPAEKWNKFLDDWEEKEALVSRVLEANK